MTKGYLANKKWRNKNRKVWNKGKALNYLKGAAHQQNARTDWTIVQCDRITDPNRPCDRVLAQELGRTVRAIQIQRSRLRKLVEPTPSVGARENPLA